jgi:putative flavoprotein involved in K+ transport
VEPLDLVVVGAGQAGLAVGYYLRRTALSHVLLDASPSAGGAWPRTWSSLRLFSPAEASSLPGWLMPSTSDGYPTRDEVVAYLTRYEHRYELPVRRPVRVHTVRRAGHLLRVDTDTGVFHSRAVVAATGTAGAPHVPSFPGRDGFAGRQLHSAAYRGPEPFAGQRVMIVGAGNSAAQTLAEVSRVAHTTWATREPPRFMPDDVDGRALFTAASRRYRERNGGPPEQEVHGLGDIVMVDAVKDARRRGALSPRPLPDRLVPDGAVWPDGRFRRLDAVIWCTGFAAALDHLGPLGIVERNGRVLVDGTRSHREPMLWLVGYGGWTGFASATLIGVGRSARGTVEQIDRALMPYARSA